MAVDVAMALANQVDVAHVETLLVATATATTATITIKLRIG